MEENPLVNEAPSSTTRTATHQRLLLSLLVAVAVFIGIGVGVFLSGGASAGQESRLIKVNHSSEPPSTAVSTAMALSEAFAQVARLVEPAVVHIETAAGPTKAGSEPFDFFHNNPRQRRHGEGSGVLVDPAGYILTNNHVIDEATTIRVRLYDGRTFTPRKVGVDPETDLAVLKIQGSAPFPYAAIGDSEVLKVGDWVLAIGSPFGLEQTVTAGIISAKDRTTAGPNANFQQFLQTDAAINPGNSGGPLVNLRGEVVGINSQISTSTGVYNGVGFAIPTSVAVGVYNQLITKGKVERGWLGIMLDEVKPEVARVYGLSEAHGALIHDVVGKDSPAAQAGLQSADIIIEYDGQRIRDQRHLIQLVAATEVGRTVLLKVMRDGRELALKATIGPRRSFGPTDPSDDDDQEPARHHRRAELGARLEPLSSQVVEDLNLDFSQGVVVSDVDEDSLASELGLQARDVILKFNRQPIRTLQQFRELVKGLRSGDDVVLEVIGPRRRLGEPGRTVLSMIVP
jgi:serine protease Do